jgi:pyruvate dehydrogenase kinase 2/3/4
MLKLLSTVRHYASRNATPLKLNYVCNYGKLKHPGNIKQQSLFLHKELPVRLAQRAVELENLPFAVSSTQSIQNVYDLYLKSFDKITSHPEPNSTEESDSFTELISNIKTEHKDLELNIANALEPYRGKHNEKNISKDEIVIIDKTLEHFYSSRIGIRFLIGQHVDIQKDSISETTVGVIDTKCDPHKVIKHAVEDVQTIVDNIFYKELEIEYDLAKSDYEFLYIPSHLYYIVFEVLKNAGRATAEFNDCTKPIKIQTSVSKDDFIIKISDYGGGFSRETMENIFSFSFTTASEEKHENRGVKIAGYGHGLGLSRIYARYFGGDMTISPVEGIGTDVYIYLNRFGDRSENVADDRT